MNDYVHMPVISVANKLLIESSRQSATHKPTHWQALGNRGGAVSMGGHCSPTPKSPPLLLPALPHLSLRVTALLSKEVEPCMWSLEPTNVMISSRKELQQLVWGNAVQFKEYTMQWYDTRWPIMTVIFNPPACILKIQYCLRSTFGSTSMTYQWSRFSTQSRKETEFSKQIPWKPVYIRDQSVQLMSEFIRETWLWIAVSPAEPTAKRGVIARLQAIHKTTMGGLNCISSCTEPVHVSRWESKRGRKMWVRER